MCPGVCKRHWERHEQFTASASSSPRALHCPWRQAWVVASVALMSLVSYRVWPRRWRQGTRSDGDREARDFSWAPHPPGHQMAHVLLLKDISPDGGPPQMPPSGSYNQSLLSLSPPGAPHHSSSHTLPMPPLTVPVENSHQ